MITTGDNLPIDCDKAKNTTVGISLVIQHRAQQIRHLIALGWDKQAAIENIRNSSTLGPASWTQLMQLIEQD